MLSGLVVGVHVGYLISEELKQPDVLALARESCSLVVGRPHVAAAELLSRTGAWTVGGRHRTLRSTDEFGTRDRIVIQTRNVPQTERQVHRGLPVRCIEVAVLDRIVIETHGYVEGCLDVRHRALELHVHTHRGSPQPP